MLSPDALKLVSYCPLCDTRGNPVNAQVVSEDREARVVYVTCRRCRHATVSLILSNQIGMSSVGLVTDLSYEDVLSFRGRSRVTVDDVLSAHAFFAESTLESLLPPAKPKPKAKAPKRRSQPKRSRS